MEKKKKSLKARHHTNDIFLPFWRNLIKIANFVPLEQILQISVLGRFGEASYNFYMVSLWEGTI